MRPIHSLFPYAKNARIHPPEQVEQIAASLLEFGWAAPILVDEDSTVIYGHGRRLGALLNIERGHKQFEQVPVITAVGWTDAQKRAYRIGDNQIALNAGWSPDLLRLELGELRGLDFAMPAIGFDDDALRELFAEPNAGQADPDDAPEPPVDPVSRLGDVWLLGAKVTCPKCGKQTDAADALKKK